MARLEKLQGAKIALDSVIFICEKYVLSISVISIFFPSISL